MGCQVRIVITKVDWDHGQELFAWISSVYVGEHHKGDTHETFDEAVESVRADLVSLGEIGTCGKIGES